MKGIFTIGNTDVNININYLYLYTSFMTCNRRGYFCDAHDLLKHFIYIHNLIKRKAHEEIIVSWSLQIKKFYLSGGYYAIQLESQR